MQNASTFGMVVGTIMLSQLTGDQLSQSIDNGTFAGQCNINAVPFLALRAVEASRLQDWRIRWAVTLFIPRRGFIHVLINIVASELVVV